MMFLKPVKALFSIQSGNDNFLLIVVLEASCSQMVATYIINADYKNTISCLAFATLEGEQSFLMKLVYLLGNIALLVMALYKCQSMGLLPTSPSDWIEFVEHKEVYVSP